jgi:hypothetical protein
MTKSNNSIRLILQIGLQLWETWTKMMMWTSLELGKVLEKV